MRNFNILYANLGLTTHDTIHPIPVDEYVYRRVMNEMCYRYIENNTVDVDDIENCKARFEIVMRIGSFLYNETYSYDIWSIIYKTLIRIYNRYNYDIR
jgi:hypothetical protein